DGTRACRESSLNLSGQKQIRRLGGTLLREHGFAVRGNAALRGCEISCVTFIEGPTTKKSAFVPGQLPPHTLADLFLSARDGPDTEFIHLKMALLIRITHACAQPVGAVPKLIEAWNDSVGPSQHSIHVELHAFPRNRAGQVVPLVRLEQTRNID